MATNILPPLPQAFLKRISSEMGEGEASALIECITTQPVRHSIRVHSQKFSAQPEGGMPVPWCEKGWYVAQADPLFGGDPLWHCGAYYVQEASSMFIARYLSMLTAPPTVAIDLCAAPGGKSTLLRSHLPADTLLVANEPDPSRSLILNENLLRHGARETIVTSAYPDRLRKAGVRADLILIDAPCSGEGMFRKDPDSRTQWSEGAVAHCAGVQREILDAAWEMLRPEGMLIYSTCTYNREENEAQLRYLRTHYDVAEVLYPETPTSWGVVSGSEEGVYRFYPHRLFGEGYTVWAVKKGEENTPLSHHLLSNNKEKQSKQPLPDFLQNLPPHSLYREGDTYYMLSREGQQLLTTLTQAKVKAHMTGVNLGSMKGKDFIPHHHWAMTPDLITDTRFPHYPLPLDEALAYLRREAVALPSDRGYALVTYQGLPLGWVKNIGTRANTLYPKELAMRSRTIDKERLITFAP